MLPLHRYEQARRDAEFHVQVQIQNVQDNVQTPGQARVDAKVVRTFRGEPSLKPGDDVRFMVSVLTGNENLEHVPIGGTIWTNYQELQAAEYLEVFLDGLPPECAIALWQQAIIKAPTDSPTMTCPPHLPQPSGRWTCCNPLRFLKRFFSGT